MLWQPRMGTAALSIAASPLRRRRRRRLVLVQLRLPFLLAHLSRAVPLELADRALARGGDDLAAEQAGGVVSADRHVRASRAPADELGPRVWPPRQLPSASVPRRHVRGRRSSARARARASRRHLKLRQRTRGPPNHHLPTAASSLVRMLISPRDARRCMHALAVSNGGRADRSSTGADTNNFWSGHEVWSWWGQMGIRLAYNRSKARGGLSVVTIVCPNSSLNK